VVQNRRNKPRLNGHEGKKPSVEKKQQSEKGVQWSENVVVIVGNRVEGFDDVLVKRGGGGGKKSSVVV